MPTLVEIGPSNASQGQHRRKDATEQIKNLTLAGSRIYIYIYILYIYIVYIIYIILYIIYINETAMLGKDVSKVDFLHYDKS